MKEIRSMNVFQYRIFSPDLIPFAKLATPFGQGLIQKAMGFRGIARAQDIAELMFQDGAFNYSESGPMIVVVAMQINDRRIIIQADGNSEAAHQAYFVLKELFSQLNERFSDAEPVVFTEETRCAVELEFDWSALLSPGLAAWAEDYIDNSVDSFARKFLKHVSLQFTIGMTIADNLRGSGIGALDKLLVVEPRADAPLSERLYFTSSPTDSETHLVLLRDLESKLATKNIKKSAKRP